MKENIISVVKMEDLGKPINPDNILTAAEVEGEDLDRIMAGCPGYEYLDEPSLPNWPPKKGVISNLLKLISDLSFAIKYPNFTKVIKRLEIQNARDSSISPKTPSNRLF